MENPVSVALNLSSFQLFPLNSFHFPDLLLQLNTGNCRNNQNLGNYDCLPVLFPDWEQYALDNLDLSTGGGSSLSPEDLADSIAWVTFLIYAMSRSMVIGAFAYPTILAGLIVSRIARA